MVWSGVVSASQNASYTTYLQSQMDPEANMQTTTTGFLQGEHSVYHTNFHLFVAAALVEIVCLAFIAPTYWGWWKLGRATSFSPLEIAKVYSTYTNPTRGNYTICANEFIGLSLTNCGRVQLEQPRT